MSKVTTFTNNLACVAPHLLDVPVCSPVSKLELESTPGRGLCSSRAPESHLINHPLQKKKKSHTFTLAWNTQISDINCQYIIKPRSIAHSLARVRTNLCSPENLNISVVTHTWRPAPLCKVNREMGRERVKNLITGTNPTISNCEQLGLSALPPGNSCCFIRMNGKQNFDFLIGGVINLLSRLGGDLLVFCAHVESLIMYPTRCSN